ncbi:MAG: FecR domain-containing protein [Pseudomonadota bacterium]
MPTNKQDKSAPLVDFPDRSRLRSEAAAWVILLGRDSVSVDDRQNLAQWLAQSSAHRAAFEELQGLDSELSLLRDLDDIGIAMADHGHTKPRMNRRRFAAGLAAAGLLAPLAGVYLTRRENAEIAEERSFVTSVGEQLSAGLSDGSSIKVNTASRVRLAFSDDERSVWLDAGEAFFSVAKDPDRPFRVYTSGGVVQAIGTAFAVRVADDMALQVSVEEGVVALSPASDATDVELAGKSGATEQLIAGQKAVFRNELQSIETLAMADLERSLAWRQGVLAYADERLADVIDDVSRYTEIKISMSGRDVAERRVAGYFRVGEVDALFESLQLSFGLQVKRVGDGYLISDSSDAP